MCGEPIGHHGGSCRARCESLDNPAYLGRNACVLSGLCNPLIAEDAPVAGAADPSKSVPDQSPGSKEPAAGDEQPEQGALPLRSLSSSTRRSKKTRPIWQPAMRRAEVHLELDESDAA